MTSEPIHAPQIASHVRAAQGLEPVDLLLKNCRIVQVYSGEIHPGDLAILNGHIVATRENFNGPSAQTLDMEGSFAAPALVDSLIETAHDVRDPAHRRGTGSLFHVAEHRGETLREHEVVTGYAELKRSLRHGRTVFIDENIGAEKVTGLLRELRRDGLDISPLCFASGRENRDEAHPVRLALQSGFSLNEAFQLASLNPATHFCRDDTIGSLAPGRQANILLFNHPVDFHPTAFYLQGRKVAPA